MNELIGKPGIPLGIEQRLEPIHEERHARNAARVRVIGHPDIDLVANADVDRDEAGAERREICRQPANSDAEFDRKRVRRARVRPQGHNALDVRQIEETRRNFFVDLRRALIDQTSNFGFCNRFFR